MIISLISVAFKNPQLEYSRLLFPTFKGFCLAELVLLHLILFLLSSLLRNHLFLTLFPHISHSLCCSCSFRFTVSCSEIQLSVFLPPPSSCCRLFHPLLFLFPMNDKFMSLHIDNMLTFIFIFTTKAFLILKFTPYLCFFHNDLFI